jgi:phosphoribosylanthranilate isomerase
MIVQIYEVGDPATARALAALGVDHIGVLVGSGEFPRELAVDAAAEVIAALPPGARASVLCLSADLPFIESVAAALTPPILHLGAAPELLGPADLRRLKTRFPGTLMMRSIPVTDASSVTLAKSYDGIADFLLLDSHRPGDRQIGALGITHDWALDRRIVAAVRVPVIIAGGLGPDNVAAAIAAVRPAGVDSKTRTDRADGQPGKDFAAVGQFVANARGGAG